MKNKSIIGGNKSAQRKMTRRQKMSSLVSRYWSWLTFSKKHYQNPAQREKARVLSIIILLLFLVHVLIDISGGHFSESPLLDILGYILMAGAFLINRYVHYVIASRLTTLLIPYLVFINAYSGKADDPILMFNFLVVNLILGGFLIRRSGVIILGLINIIGIGLAPALLSSSGVTLAGVLPPLFTNLISTVLIVIYMRHQDLIKNTLQPDPAAQDTSFRSIFYNSPLGILFAKEGATLFNVNQAACDLLDYNKEELVGKKIFELIHPEDYQGAMKIFLKVIAAELPAFSFETRFINKHGEIVWVNLNGTLQFSDTGIPNTGIAILEEITDKKKTEEDLHQEKNKAQKYLDLAGVIIVALDTEGRITLINQKGCETLGVSQEEIVGEDWFDNFTPPEVREEVRSVFNRLIQDELKPVETFENQIICRNGETRYISWHNAQLTNGSALAGTLSVGEDITERKANEEILEIRLEHLRILQDVSAICLENMEEDQVISQITKLIGENLYPDHFGVMALDTNNVLQLHPSYQGLADEDFDHLLELGKGIAGIAAAENRMIRIDDVAGDEDYISPFTPQRSELCVPIAVNGTVFGVINAESRQPGTFTSEDETLLKTIADQLALAIQKSRLFHEEKMRRREAETQQAISSELTKSLDLNTALENILIIMQRYLGFDTGGVFLQDYDELNIVATYGFDDPDHLIRSHNPREVPLYQVLINTKTYIILDDVKQEPRFMNFGAGQNIRSWLGVPLIDKGQVFGFVSFDGHNPNIFSKEKADLAQSLVNQLSPAILKAKSFEETQLGLRRLGALHDIDRIITSSVDLSFAIEQIIQIIVSQLQIDAASVLTFDNENLTFRSLTSIGFWGNAEFHENLNGNSFATRVTLERKIIKINDKHKIINNFDPDSFIAREGFYTYIGVPLIAKGEVKGVLELFHRSLLVTDHAWEGFLNTLTTQLAIAFDNSQMFENLQKTNLELVLSYDATIEGWAKTLELRDQETQGHSERVTAMTVRLAKAMGVTGSDLIHIRRGAILHDVGKIGIPDSILQKPGQLTVEEREIMEEHPTLAYDVLSGSEFLENALSIPYCHHEKWDGTGYPRQLRGEEIPLAARIFTIIDVYDALRSNRPYRNAWSKSKTIDFIKAESGSHFDPRVVEIFLTLVDKEQEFNVY